MPSVDPESTLFSFVDGKELVALAQRDKFTGLALCRHPGRTYIFWKISQKVGWPRSATPTKMRRIPFTRRYGRAGKTP